MEFRIANKYILDIEHRNETIHTCISDFTAGNFSTMVDTRGEYLDAYKEVNLFVATLAPSKQQALLNAYKSVTEEVAIGAVDIDVVIKVGTKALEAVFEIVNVDEIEKFITAKNLYFIPPDVNDAYTGEHVPDRTYIKDKYIGLLALAIATRFAIPVWGEIAILIKGVYGKRIPITLLHMLNNTHLFESHQFLSLERYILGTIGAGSLEGGRIVAGFGTEYNEAINISTILVKRLAIANLTKNIATNVFNFIANKGVYNDTATGDIVWRKQTHGDEEKSHYEMYSMREKMSQGDIALIEYFLSNPRRVVQRLFRNFEQTDERMRAINKSIRTLHKHLEKEDFKPTPLNLRLSKWLLAGLVPPKTLLYCGTYYQQLVVAITSVVLKNLGMVNLSMLPLAEFQYSQTGHTLAFKQSRKLIPDDLQAQLDELYPLSRVVRDREHPNMARNAINRYYVELNNSIMKLCCDKDTLDYYIGAKMLNRHQRFTVDPSINVDLCTALITFNKLTKR